MPYEDVNKKTRFAVCILAGVGKTMFNCVLVSLTSRANSDTMWFPGCVFSTHEKICLLLSLGVDNFAWHTGQHTVTQVFAGIQSVMSSVQYGYPKHHSRNMYMYPHD